ncbi:MAG: transporter substrate-binding domain-containing protein [Alphaproteobacteria bacterium]|nr:transporter substrate-binding domain-containing protein [Alphaproteobacteria bacterium]
MKIHGRIGAALAGGTIIACLSLAVLGTAQAQAPAIPEKIRESKTLNISVSNDFPPMGFKDPKSGELSGLSTEIVRAIGVNLGITFNLVDVAFPQVFPGLDSGRFDFVASSIVDFPARREKLTHVNYLRTGPQIFTSQANAGSIKEITDLCGRSMGYPRYITVYPVILKELSDAECVAKGRKPIELVSSDLPVQIGLQQNRYEATMQTIEVVRHLQRQDPGRYVQIGKPLREWLYGFGFLKANDKIRDYVAAGLQRIIDDGTYAKILARYNAEDFGVSKATIDAGKP